MARDTLKKAVIVAGGRGTAVCPLASYYPKLAFPIGHAPVIAHLLNYLHKNGISEVAIVASEKSDAARQALQACVLVPSEKMRVEWFFDDGTKGTAGSLKPAEAFVGEEDFLVLQPNLYIHELDLSEIVRSHSRRSSGITVVVEDRPQERTDFEHIEIDMSGRLHRFDVPHYAKANDHPLAFSGLYVFSPRVLKTYDEEGYVDIKEQLFPLLKDADIPVHVFRTQGVIKRINTLDDYFRLSGEYLFNGVGEVSPFLPEKKEVMHGVWVGKNVKIAPSAYIVGPVIVGDNCTIEEDAQIIGPTTLSPGTCVEKGARVRESIIWEGSRLGQNARIEYSLVADRCVVPDGEIVSNALVIEDDRVGAGFNFMTSMTPQRVAAVGGGDRKKTLTWTKGRSRRLSLTLKRCFDVAVSVMGILVALPLFVVIALAIKLTSRGPIIFSQVRQGQDGIGFRMFKFRSMIQDAEKTQDDLAKHKENDGPMFKLDADPRITKTGKLLRKTSLDELPQLFNVLRGDMSLVGPRPLAYKEMKCSPSWRDIRLSVKPGITGLWQVKGRGSPHFHDWIEYDINYVLNHSFWGDIGILCRTAWVALVGTGAK